MGIGLREGVLFGANLGRAIVTRGDVTAYVCDSAATRPFSQITLSRLVTIHEGGCEISFSPVCLSVCPVCALNSESLDLEASFFGMWVRLQNIQVKFVYQGHGVKVKVTQA